MKKSRISLNNSIYLVACLLFVDSVTASDKINLAHMELIASLENYVFESIISQSSEDSENLNVSASKLDPRIVVPQCNVPFVFSANQESLRQSNITVRASCPSNKWYLYLMVKAARVQPVVVLTRAVGPGTVLNAQNVKVVMMDKTRIRTSTFSDPSIVVGARMKKRSRSGQPVVPGQLCFVCKGDSIVITANAGGVSIKTSGIAQQDGNVGDTIAVKNSKSQRLLHAQVIDTRQVEVQI